MGLKFEKSKDLCKIVLKNYLVSLGTRWINVPGKLNRIESGPNGAVWGVTKKNIIFTRAGVSRRNPVGRRWVQVGGRLSYVSVGCTGVYGVSRNYAVWKYRGKLKQICTWTMG